MGGTDPRRDPSFTHQESRMFSSFEQAQAYLREHGFQMVDLKFSDL
jgi:hypothetical protein